MLFALPFFFESARGFAFLGFLFWIWMIYHCATREPNGTPKILWLLFVVLGPDIGALVYFFIRVVKIRG